MISFILFNEPVSLNVSLGQHWAVRSRRNKKLHDTVFAGAWNAGWNRRMPPFTQVGVIIRNWRGDFDNAVAGCKPLIDALVKNGIIKDDNPKECRITYRLVKSDIKGKSVEIILEATK